MMHRWMVGENSLITFCQELPYACFLPSREMIECDLDTNDKFNMAGLWV